MGILRGIGSIKDAMDVEVCRIVIPNFRIHSMPRDHPALPNESKLNNPTALYIDFFPRVVPQLTQYIMTQGIQIEMEFAL